MPPTPDTIAAISTPPGEGAIGIVRLSGPEAIPIASTIFRSTTGRDLAANKARIFHGEIRDERGPVDEVLVHVMRAPHSYTCEDIVEINGHGGAAPLQAILELVLRKGARLAQPGEFTKRAFLNGRIDLVQAEAVIDRIRARTDAALRAASSAAAGTLSQTVVRMHQVLAGALARVESAIDFPDEDLPELVDEALRQSLERARNDINELLRTADAGRLYREGAAVAIAGRPNVGKSSLFNALLRDARAIVTAQPGTTRDLLEETISISGIPIRLADTAGLRPTEDEVERIGIEVARNKLATADIILFLIDAEAGPTEDDHVLAREVLALDRPSILVLNKIDLQPNPAMPEWSGAFHRTVLTTTKDHSELKPLEDTLADMLLGGVSLSPSQVLVTRVHQKESLRRAAQSLDRILENFSASPEFLSIDLKDALNAIGEITGATTPEDILDRIFSQFCIGK